MFMTSDAQHMARLQAGRMVLGGPGRFRPRESPGGTADWGRNCGSARPRTCGDCLLTSARTSGASGPCWAARICRVRHMWKLAVSVDAPAASLIDCRSAATTCGSVRQRG
jgi:hypothetical protein